jgi:hypothetical protein
VAVVLEVVQDREAGATALVAAADPVRVTAGAVTGKDTVPDREVRARKFTAREVHREAVTRVAQAAVEAATRGYGILSAVAAEDRDWIQMLEASGRIKTDRAGLVRDQALE